MNQETWEKEFTKWWDGHCRKIGGIVERGIAYQDTRDFFLYQIIQVRQQREKEILEEIINKIDKDYKGRDITIYELGDWLNKKLKELK